MLYVVLALLLVADPVVDPARAELDRVASRIERLKSRRLAGEDVTLELERLLAHAQELAQRIERERRGAPPAAAPAVAPGLPPEELRERADALRDESDRIAMQLRELDRQIDAVRRERRVEAGLESLTQERALFGDPGASRVSPKATLSGDTLGGDADAAKPGDFFGPRGAGAGETSRGTALQRLDRLRA
ncbi:MAG: hypothetical protein WCC48_09485, partial [Anaeromyxobacteraceae bacterium]